MNGHYNKDVMFIYCFGIVLMGAVITAAAQNECAKLTEACDFSGARNKTCCKGMRCALSQLSFKWECEFDPNAQAECRGPGQPCGNLDAGSTPAISSEDNMPPPAQPQLSANTTCCDNIECDVFSRTCKFPGLTCRKKGQACGLVDNDPNISDNQKARLSFNPFCCPGLACGLLGWCDEPLNVKCRKEGESCRLIKCCEGLHCNPVENDHTGEKQYQCQSKTCNIKGTCPTIGNSGCCDSHYCKPHWLVAGICTERGN